jgi:hypothetical protein
VNLRRCNGLGEPVYSALMTRFLAALLAAAALSACSSSDEPPRQSPIARADVVPLALSDDFKFRKVTKFLNDPRFQKPTQDQMLVFERQRVNFGAVTSLDQLERRGYYFNVWWSSKRQTDVTLRLEYRQEKLGSYVQAKELHYPAVKGGVESQLRVIGDEYNENGRITAWRLLLIENGRAVGLHQSFLWN